MECYGSIARVYDLFMEEVPYMEWVDYLEHIWDKNSFKPKTVLELGCGTGNITQRLWEKGYDMIGLDISTEMLAVAKEKSDMANAGILYLNQDMTSFELYGTVDCIICLCDGINYVLNTDGLMSVFKLAKNYLNPDGFFIFDLNTEHKFKNILDGRNFGQAYEDCAYICENVYDENDKIIEYYTVFFDRNETGGYERHEECHYQKAHDAGYVTAYLKDAGLQLIGIYGGQGFEPPAEDCERMYFVAKKA